MTSLRGTVTSGLGQGAHFMNVPWVREAVRRLVGFMPYPGTLNVRLDEDTADAWQRLHEGHALVLAPPPPETCGGRLVPITVAPGVEAAVIVPDVTRHGRNLLEVIASVHIRTRLGLTDDDPVTFSLRSEPS